MIVLTLREEEELGPCDSEESILIHPSISPDAVPVLSTGVWKGDGHV